MKKSLIRQLKSEDWVIVGAGAAILLLALLFPRWMPAMPKDLSSAGNWMSAGAMFLFLTRRWSERSAPEMRYLLHYT